MVRAQWILKTGVKALFFVLLAKLAQLSGVWISKIMGSYSAHFSLSSCMPAVVGLYGGVAGSLLVALFGGGAHLVTGMGIGKLLAYTIPGLCASLSWSTRSSFFRVVLPLFCIALFVMHPVGGAAACYSFYWLLPAALALCTRNLICDALISTFVAHAVGSVIWLYTVPMVAGQWLSLIPVVPFERCAIAFGMVLLYSAARQLFAFVQRVRMWHAASVCSTHILEA